MKVAGVDVFYTDKKAFTGVVIMDENEVKVKRVFESLIPYPYIPSRFSLREGPLIINALSKIDSFFDVLFCNGHGILHPEKRGLATVVGEITGLPSLGVAKELLVGSFEPPERFKGCFSYVHVGEEVRGVAIRTGEGKGVIFVSPGFKVEVDEAYAIVLRFLKHKIPEPLRIAHIVSKRAGKGKK